MADPQSLANALMNSESAAFGIYPNAGKRKNNDRVGSADMPVQLLRGMAAGTLGLPGDIETIGRQIIKAGATPGSYVDRNMSNTSALPTSDFYKKYIPLGTESAGGKAAANVGAMLGIPGIGAATGVVKPIGRGLMGMGENAMAPNGANVLRSMHENGKIGGPKDLPIRSFIDDYPGTSSSNVGGKLTADIDGNPLAAQHIAGRRIWGGPDEALSNGAIEDVSRQLGASIRQANSSDNIGRDLGRYVSGSDASGDSLRQILLSGKLNSQEVPHVLAHEVGHLIDDLTFGRMIPTKGIKKEGAQVYSDLNSSTYVPKGKIGATPETFKYSGNDIPAEINAESIRAYMQNPNYIKTVAPNMAKRIREFVNSNPNLNKTIQFNSAGAVGVLGANGVMEDFANSVK